MVIVAGSHRGRGIGRRLMKLALRDAGARSVMLNATPSGQPLYAKLGFRRVGDIEQHQGMPRSIPVVSPGPGERLRPVGASDEPDLVALATRASGCDRARVVAQLLKEGEAIVLARQGQALGFAMCRRFGRGRVIGPVVASDADRARALIGYWVATFPGKFLRIDVPAPTGLGKWLDGIGLKRVDTAVTMVKGTPPAGDADVRSFALANQALG
jgi:ribosomal protein S18 acetylase RimI-like enzyme